MKFPSSTVTVATAAAMLSSFPPSILAWAPASSWMRTTSSMSYSSSAALGNRPTFVALSASVMADDDTATVETVQHQHVGRAVARGSIVSFFRGGLAAVRLEDEDLGGAGEDISPLVLSDIPVPGTGGGNNTSNRQSDLLGHQVVFPDGSKGVVVAHRPPIVFAYNGEMDNLAEQDGKVDVLSTMAPVPVSDDILVVGWDGQPWSPLPTNVPTKSRDMFAPIPQVKDIALINNPMLTGISLFDVLAPIGQGQNMLVVGHDLNGMRDYMCDFITTQVKGIPTGKQAPKIVYAAIDDSKSVVEKLHAAGVMDDVHVVLSSPKTDGGVEEAAMAAEATAMAATACSIAESYALEEGRNTVVIIDSLDQHKKLWDTTTRVLVDVFGVDAVVKGDLEGSASSEMRAYYSSIIQRAGQFKEKKGGGSVTLVLLTSIPKMASGEEDTVYSPSDFENSSERVRTRIQLLVSKNIPLTAATLRKIDIPIPSISEGQRRLVLQHIDDLVSMSDGQIWLDEKLQEAGQRPPMDPQRSVTRIGIGADTDSRADAPAIRKVAEGLRLALSQAAYVEGAENTAASQKQLRRMRAYLLAMYQEAGQGGRTLSETCTSLLAASRGFLDDAIGDGKLAGTEGGRQLISDMLDHVQVVAPDSMAEVDSTLDMSDDAQKSLIDAIKSFFSS